MERSVLVLLTAAGALVPLVAAAWRGVSPLATLVVGAVGFVLSLRAERRAGRAEERALTAEARASREEERAIRAERRAEDAEERAEDAERREQEAHEWDRERREAEQARLRARKRVEQWVAEKKAIQGTAYFPVADSDLDLARAAAAAGLVDLKELRGGDGSVVDAMASVCGGVISAD